jgi:hypothetical protein
MRGHPYGVNVASRWAHPDAYTIAELTRITDLTERELRHLVLLAHIQPVALRPCGPRGGRPARAYPLDQITRAAAAVHHLRQEETTP